MMPWQIFLTVGLILIVAEIFIPGFVVLPVGLGFFITAVVGLFTDNLTVLYSVLAFVQIALLYIFQRWFKRFQAKTNAFTNVEGMVGKEVEVTEAIIDHHQGYVKLYGDRWPAHCELGITLEKGSRAVIVATESNKVIVEPINN